MWGIGRGDGFPDYGSEITEGHRGIPGEEVWGIGRGDRQSQHPEYGMHSPDNSPHLFSNNLRLSGLRYWNYGVAPGNSRRRCLGNYAIMHPVKGMLRPAVASGNSPKLFSGNSPRGRVCGTVCRNLSVERKLRAVCWGEKRMRTGVLGFVFPSW